MDINPNLSLLMEKLFDNEDVVDRIMKTDDINELYILCQRVQDGYSFEEFEDFFESLVCICIDEAKDLKDFVENNADKIDKLSEKDLKNIAGGISKVDKFTASVLAAMISLTNGSMYHAQGTSDTDNTMAADALLRDAAPGEENDKEIVLRDASLDKPAIPASTGEKIKNWFNKAADYVWENKGAFIGGGLALIATGAFLAYNHQTIGENVRELVNRHNDLREINEKINFLDHMPTIRPGSPGSVIIMDEQGVVHPPEAWKLELWDRYHNAADEVNRNAIGDELRRQRTESENQGIIKTLTNNLAVIGGVSALLSGTATALSGLTGFVNKFAQTATDIETLKYYHDKGKKDLVAWQNSIKLLAQIQDTKNYNADKEEEYLRDVFKHRIHGQEKAKESVMSFFMQLSEERKAAAMGATSSDLPAPKVLVFNGPSGTGKTFMAELLSKSITGISPFFISADDVLKASRGSSPSAMSNAFFYGNTQNGGNSKSDMSSQNNNLISFLESTEGTIRVVIFDEWDKIYKKDGKGNYIDTSPLDETFRSILDNKYSDYNGRHIDLSGTVFIVTTNETIASLQGRIQQDPSTGELVEALVDENGDPILDENGRQVYGKPTRDVARAQTVVPHDVSVMARLAGSICYFDKLVSDDYKAIAEGALGDDRTIKNTEDYGKAGRPDKISLIRRLTSGVGGIIIPDKGYRLIADYASNMPNAARAIVGAGGNKTGSVAGNLNDALIEYIGNLKKASKSCKNLVLLAEPYVDADSTNRKIIKFKIKAVGYVDQEHTYEQYYEKYKGK